LLALYAERKTAEGFAFSATARGSANSRTLRFERRRPAHRHRRHQKRPRKATPMIACSAATSATAKPKWRCAPLQGGCRQQTDRRSTPDSFAFQHFETSRNASPLPAGRNAQPLPHRAEQKVILADLEAGKVDIVIGTHACFPRT